MDLALITVAERLAAEFPNQPETMVIRVLTDCAEEFPDAGPLFVEQESGARLAAVPPPGEPDRDHG